MSGIPLHYYCFTSWDWQYYCFSSWDL